MDDLKLFDNIGKVLDHLPVKCAAIAVNFTKERFRTQNWLDKTPEPWKPRKRRTGRESLHYLSLNAKLVLFMTAFLIVVGAIFILILEYQNPATLGPLSFFDKFRISLL